MSSLGKHLFIDGRHLPLTRSLVGGIGSPSHRRVRERMYQGDLIQESKTRTEDSPVVQITRFVDKRTPTQEAYVLTERLLADDHPPEETSTFSLKMYGDVDDYLR